MTLTKNNERKQNYMLVYSIAVAQSQEAKMPIQLSVFNKHYEIKLSKYVCTKYGNQQWEMDQMDLQIFFWIFRLYIVPNLVHCAK